ncbi:MAG TPA: hypothetical protein VHG28_13295 [Longimicrobiaceae bacterium]|nr:hypothetical protein [Longimicrobiaceae bacterium]
MINATPELSFTEYSLRPPEAQVMGSFLRLLFGLLLPILTLLIALEASPKTGERFRRWLNARTLLGLTVLVALVTMGLSAVEFYQARSADAEGRTRFEETVRRDSMNLLQLEQLLGRTEEISQTSRSLADSLQQVLALSDSSIVQQQALLHSLAVAQDSQKAELAQQRALNSSQRALFVRQVAERFPLVEPITLEGVVSYPFHTPGLANDVARIIERAEAYRSKLFVHHDSTMGVFSDSTEHGLQWQVSTRGALIKFTEDDQGRIQLDTISFPAMSDWMPRGTSAARNPLSHLSFLGTISRKTEPFPFELSFSAFVENDGYSSPPSHDSGPRYTHYIILDVRRAVVEQHFTVLEAYVRRRTAALTLLDLHCSEVTLSLEAPLNEFATITEAEIGFGAAPASFRKLRLAQSQNRRVLEPAMQIRGRIQIGEILSRQGLSDYGAPPPFAPSSDLRWLGLATCDGDAL